VNFSELVVGDLVSVGSFRIEGGLPLFASVETAPVVSHVIDAGDACPNPGICWLFFIVSLTLQHETQVAALPKEVATEVFQFLQGVKDWYFEEA